MTTKPIAAPLAADATSGWRIRAYQIAWVLALCFYFLEYASRSAPAVMIEHLATAFGTTAIGVVFERGKCRVRLCFVPGRGDTPGIPELFENIE